MPYSDPDKHRESARDRARGRLARFKKAGLCVRCGKVPPAPGKASCDPRASASVPSASATRRPATRRPAATEDRRICE